MDGVLFTLFGGPFVKPRCKSCLGAVLSVTVLFVEVGVVVVMGGKSFLSEFGGEGGEMLVQCRLVGAMEFLEVPVKVWIRFDCFVYKGVVGSGEYRNAASVQ